jgi:hypothetical protein
MTPLATVAVGLALMTGAIALQVADRAPALPQARLTPGDVATSDPDVICHRGYSTSQRVWNTEGPAGYYEMRRTVFARYGIAPRDQKLYTLDDRVSLCMGGKQTLLNVWPEPIAEAHQKDRLENMVCHAACQVHTREAIESAQEYFRSDAWVKDMR